jgi:ABC-2 type transport system permease protein
MPVWLQDVVRVNPVSYAIDGVRQMLIGSTGMNSLLIDFAVIIAFAAVLSIIGIVLSWRYLSK